MLVLTRILATSALCLFSLTAFADTGVPMLAVIWPVFWMALLPIIGIEYAVLRKRLTEFTSKRLLLAACVSNLVSTFIGIPLTWGCWVGLQWLGMTVPIMKIDQYWLRILNVTVGAAWLVPYESHLYWMIPTAALVILIPCFFVSYWIEATVTLKLLKNPAQRASIKQAVKIGNILSYSLLAIMTLVYLADSLFKHFN